MSIKKPGGFSSLIKDKLIQQAHERKRRQFDQLDGETAAIPTPPQQDVPEQFYRFNLHPSYQQLRIINDGAARIGIENPFFKQHEGIAGAETKIAGRVYVNYSSYNYLGLSGYEAVSNAAKQAIDQYGTSVSASRPVSGERPIHRELERALANVYQVEDVVVFVSGHATNVSVIGHLMGSKDLVLHDEFIHNSALQGMLLSGAKRMSFPHNDWHSLDKLLVANRKQFERVLIVLEGIYSMDGDYPDLPRFVEIKKRHRVWLMVDEAHSFGVMGQNGFGIREHFDLKNGDVDIWMGTLSKALASCGGYIAGETALIEHLKFLAPGFLYSVGMSPSLAAASLAALQCLIKEPHRVRTLQARGQYMLERLRAAAVDVGSSSGFAVIPAIVGSSIKAARLSAALFKQGINVQPILYPAVPEKAARLRFFVSSDHTEAQIDETVDVLAREWALLS